MIELQAVTKRYINGMESLTVLKEIDLTVADGEFVSIMGPSGSGKSTLMHIVGLLDVPTSGTYRFEGLDTSVMSRKQLASMRNRSIGFVFQNFHLLPRMNALRNVELPMLYGGSRRGERRDRAMELLSRVGLTERALHLPAALSGGQKQRVAIARALANQPKLILADEPTGALDQNTGREIMDILQSLNRSGTTIMIITHDPSIAAAANRTIHIVDGVIVDEVSAR